MLFREMKPTLKIGENGQDRHEVGKGGLTQTSGECTHRGRLPMAEAPGSGAGDQGQPVHGSGADSTEGAGSWVRRGDGIGAGHLASVLNGKVAGHWTSA